MNDLLGKIIETKWFFGTSTLYTAYTKYALIVKVDGDNVIVRCCLTGNRGSETYNVKFEIARKYAFDPGSGVRYNNFDIKRRKR